MCSLDARMWERVKMIENNATKLAGTTGLRVPVDVLQVSKFLETGREMSLRSKEFEINRSLHSSGLSRWAIANCSKSITGEEFWETVCTRDRASAARLLLPWMWLISDVNWDMKSRCPICLGEWRLCDDDREYVRVLWSVRTWNWWPSSICWKCLIERYIASSSWSKVLYCVSTGLNFLEK